MAKMQDYFKYNSYYSLLISTKKYKEFYSGTVAKVSAIMSIVLTMIIAVFFCYSTPIVLTETLSAMCLVIAPGLIGLLGFLVTGVSLLAVMMTDRALKRLEEDGIIEALVGILFSFYFIGSIIGIAIFMLIISYLFLQFEFYFNEFFFILIVVLDIYICTYSILYTIGLLGSCINAFFVNLALSKEFDIKNNKELK